jgi:serine protease AprX
MLIPALLRLSHVEGANLSTSKSYAIVSALLALALLVLAAPATSAQPDRASINIYLRRATFDPLRTTPSIASTLQADTTSRLVLAQFTTEPTAKIRQALAAAGARPLLYIPDNALVVRLGNRQPAALPDLPGLRWYGPFAPAYKLADELDATVNGVDASALDLRLLADAGADTDLLIRDLGALGGAVLGRSRGLNGVELRVRLPANALRRVLRRDDVLWVERFVAPRVQNDRARDILGVTSARQQLGWLTGAGQIVAATDTGLDVEASVLADTNPDFPASRIAAAFSPAQVDSACASSPNAAVWSDRHGHGTHVAGTILGTGARSPSGLSFAGIAPEASLIVQAGSTGGDEFDCLQFDSTFLAQAYTAGARVQNASWGAPTGTNTYGGYTQFSSDVDDFLWQHKDHLLVVAAGNYGKDANPREGVIDPDSIGQPATAKNVLSVGASENNRLPTSAGCDSISGSPQDLCWSSFVFSLPPISDDFISNNTDGIAAWSGRGPTDDGRIKPEIVAPGTNIISAASQDPSASYQFPYPGGLYAYDSGTSMSAPMLSGMAALTRQWLAQSRQITAPSAALIKALLLNGAADIDPGQYGEGATREIPASWPNNVEGWGRAALVDTLGMGGTQEVWLADNTTGLAAPGATATYSLIVSSGQPLRLSLAWADYPGSPQSAKALVNDLDLEVQTADGTIVRGNAAAALTSGCRDAETRADRCNNVESVEIATPIAGLYTVRVRAAKLPQPAQPFALVGRAQTITDHPLDPPVLQPISNDGGPAVQLNWNAIHGATFYLVEQSATSDFAAISQVYSASAPSTAIVEDIGTYWFRVSACTLGSCSSPSAPRSAKVLTPPRKFFLPLVSRQ